MKKILLTKKLKDDTLGLFKGLDVELINVPEGDVDFLVKHIKDADAILLSTAFKITEELIESANNLKVISRTGVGVDNVDVNAATQKRYNGTKYSRSKLYFCC